MTISSQDRFISGSDDLSQCVYTVQLIVCATNFAEQSNFSNTFVDTINRCQPEPLVCDGATEFTIVLFDFNNAYQSDTLPGVQFSDSNMYIFLFTKLLL